MSTKEEEALLQMLERLRRAIEDNGGDGRHLTIQKRRNDDPFGAKGMFYRVGGMPVEEDWLRAGSVIEKLRFAETVLRLLP